METWDYNKIMSDRKLFNQTVYTPLSEAVKILDERQKDSSLIKKIEELLGNDIPEPFKEIGKYGISGKQIATPNFDTRCFIELAKTGGLRPVFYEYHNDKFVSCNDFKHSLGQLHIYKKKPNKKGDVTEEKITIIDFNKADGKKLKDIKTVWGEPLVDFHKKLFEVCGYLKEDFVFYDNSTWLERNGEVAEKYYEMDLMLYICHGILFENFLLEGEEGEFTKKIFLPAFEKVIKTTGLKPLIVPIPPMETENEGYWVSYDKIIKPSIKL